MERGRGPMDTDGYGWVAAKQRVVAEVDGRKVVDVHHPLLASSVSPQPAPVTSLSKASLGSRRVNPRTAKAPFPPWTIRKGLTH